MKRFIIASLLIIGVLCACAYFVYRTVMPEVIAGAVVSESMPAYIPKRLKARVEAIRAPINKGTGAMIEKMHESEIPLDRVLKAIDAVTEEQTNAFLDEINETNPSNTNEVFDVVKKHFRTNTLDLEIFREPFNEHFEMKQVRKGLSYANLNRRSNDVDMATAKAILKKIIVEKEKEMEN